MLNLISRIGRPSVVPSTPGRSTGKGSGYITATVDKASLAKVTRQLESVDKKVRDKVAKKALRDWGKQVRRVTKAAAWKRAERTKKQITFKVKVYKRAIWAGVGVKTERIRKGQKAERPGRYSAYVGWKAHFMEVGWHAWPKGKSGNKERVQQILRNNEIDAGRARIITYKRTLNGKVIVQATRERKRAVSKSTLRGGGGRGWKKGLRGYKGVFQSQYARHYMWKGWQHGKRIAPSLVVQGIEEGLRDAAKAA